MIACARQVREGPDGRHIEANNLVSPRCSRAALVQVAYREVLLEGNRWLRHRADDSCGCAIQ